MMPTPTDSEPRSSSPHSHSVAEADDDPYPAGDHAQSPIRLELIDPSNLLSPNDHTRLEAWAGEVLIHLDATGSVRVKLVNDAQMSVAHLRYSGIEGTTDVLTFDLNDSDSSPSTVLDTDLIVCVNEAARQATVHGHTPALEILLYIIHGTLHCLGYNDHTDADYKAMHAREDQLLTSAGIGPLFNRNDLDHDDPDHNEGTRS